MVEFTVPEIDLPVVDYTRYSNRQLLAVPLAALAVAIVILVGWTLVTGSPVAMGTEFTGGTQVRVAVDAPGGGAESTIRSAFDAPIESIRYVPATEEYILTFGDDADSQQLIDAAQSDPALSYRGFSQVDPTFGADMRRSALVALGVAFAGMSILVFALFRAFVPSIAVVASAFSDIVIPLALMSVFGVQLSLGTVAALLMIIGYSVDSDILLNTHVLRRPGDFYESTYRAMRTGVTMTVTSLVAMLAMAVTAWLFGVGLMASIGIVLVFGLAADLMNTYMLNVTLLRWYKFEGIGR